MGAVVKHIRGLFWKIFLAFWLANLIIMSITTFVVTKNLQVPTMDPVQRAHVTDFAREIVTQFEQGIDVSLARNVRPILRRYRRGGDMPLRPFTITDGAGVVVYEHKFGAMKGKQAKNTFPLFSVNGVPYVIEAYFGFPKKYFLNRLRSLNKIQLVLVLFASALVSLGLSWTITRPLKNLGNASRGFTGGGGALDIDPSLLTRRDEIGDLSRDFRTMGLAVEKNIKRQKQLLHDVSHELRAPLARLQAAAGLVQQQKDGAKHVDRLHKECDKISSLIQNILDYSRMDQTEPVPQSVDFVNLIETQLDNVCYEFPSRKPEFTNRVGELTVTIFPELFESALSNVLRNACKHTVDGSLIAVSLGVESDIVTVKVRDFGDGVDPSELKKLLVPFYRTGNKMHSEGHGLGLSIAKRAMEKHNGDLILENHPEGGLVVTLSFPCELLDVD